MNEFIPENELEKSLVAAMNGQLSEVALMEAFFAGDVFVLLNQPLGDDGLLGDARPATCRMNDGNYGIAVYTSLNRADLADNSYSHALRTKFTWVVSLASKAAGIAVNPRLSHGFEISPSGVSQLKANLPR